MISIWHVPRTRSIRVIWLCEELGLEYERVLVDFSPEYRFGAEWLVPRDFPEPVAEYWGRLSARPGYIAAIQ